MPISSEDLNELLTKKQAAEILEVSPRTLDNIIARHAIEVIRLSPRRVRIRRRALLDYVNRNTEKALPDRRRGKAAS